MLYWSGVSFMGAMAPWRRKNGTILNWCGWLLYACYHKLYGPCMFRPGTKTDGVTTRNNKLGPTTAWESLSRNTSPLVSRSRPCQALNCMHHQQHMGRGHVFLLPVQLNGWDTYLWKANNNRTLTWNIGRTRQHTPTTYRGQWSKQWYNLRRIDDRPCARYVRL